MRFVLAVLFSALSGWAALAIEESDRSLAAVDRSSAFHGSVETGLSLGLAPGYSQWMVDQIEWNQRFDASDRVKFHLNTSIALVAPSAAGTGAGNNSASYFSQMALSGGSGITVANSGAYVQARLLDWLTLSAGHLRVAYGQQWDAPRYDHLLYYYSETLREVAARGWLWDLGAQVEFRKVLPGKLKIALLDGRTAGGEATPALSVNYQFSYDMGSVVLMPSAFVYLSEFLSLPQESGFGFGLSLLSGAFTLNSEFLRARGAAFNTSSIVVEPAFDLGPVEIALGGELANKAAGSDLHLRASLMKHFADRLRLRILFQATNLLSTLGTGDQEVRVLLGTHW